MMEPVLEERGFTFVQYVVTVLAARRHRGESEGPSALSIATTAARSLASSTNWRSGDLLERVRRDRDRRKVELQLTPAGREAIESRHSRWWWRSSTWRWPISASEEVQELLRLLIKLNTSLQEHIRPSSPRAEA